MENLINQKQALLNEGFAVLDHIYTKEEVQQILKQIVKADTNKDTFRKSADLFAIRQFLKEIPETIPLIFNEKLKSILRELLGKDYFVVKSIYFDKPENSNWYVAYHQDLTVSVDKKLEIENFSSWTTKQNQFAVQPPIEVLENISTFRIHLDDTNEENGALRVIPKSHLRKIYRPETIDWAIEQEVTCNVGRGGIMLMKPLILHCSDRSTNHQRRRVIHLEFSNIELPKGLNWAERMDFN